MTSEESKAEYSKNHAVERALERFGIVLSDSDFNDIISLIQGGDSDTVKFIGRQSLYRTVWLLTYRSKEMVAVYNKKQKVVSTFLTLDMDFRPSKGGGYENNPKYVPTGVPIREWVLQCQT